MYDPILIFNDDDDDFVSDGSEVCLTYYTICLLFSFQNLTNFCPLSIFDDNDDDDDDLVSDVTDEGIRGNSLISVHIIGNRGHHHCHHFLHCPHF